MSIRKKIKAVVFLGMNPWYHKEINDTVRFLTRAAVQVDRFYLNPPPGLKNSLQHLTQFKRAFSWQIEEDEGVRVFTPPLGFVPVALGLREQAEAWTARQFAQWLQQRYGPEWREQVLVYISSWSYTQANFIRQLAPRYLLFHLLDDTLAFPMIKNEPRVWRENQKFLADLMNRSNLVLAVSEELARKYGALYAREILVVKNGVDVEMFRGAPAINLPSELAAFRASRGNRDTEKNDPPPVLMYVGSINSLVDLNLLVELARQKPDYNLVLIGHCFEDTIVLEPWERLLAQPNVYWLKSKPYALIPSYMQAASVLLLPRTEAEHSRASDPLKLYEYLSTGKPIVSTALPAVEDFRELVYVARSPDEFAGQIETALTQHGTPQAQRQQAVVEKHSWSSRIREIEHLWEKHVHD